MPHLDYNLRMETGLQKCLDCLATRYNTIKENCLVPHKIIQDSVRLDGVIHSHFFTLKITIFGQHNLSKKKKKQLSTRNIFLFTAKFYESALTDCDWCFSIITKGPE